MSSPTTTSLAADDPADTLAAERSFLFLADMIPAQVWTARPDGRLDYVNRRVTEFFGRPAAELTGDGWARGVHPDDRAAAAERWAHCVATGEPYELEFRLRRADGEYRWHIARAMPLRDRAGHVDRWFGTNTDVSDLKEAAEALARNEEALRNAKEHLEERVRERTRELDAANRELSSLNDRLQVSNRELQDFASVASHDLQEPLRKIQAFGDRLAQRAAGAVGEEGLDFLRRMQGAARRMQTLINDLLAFARVTTKAKPFEPVDLGQVAAEVLVDLEERVRQSGGRVDVGPLPTIDADPTQARQLLLNLLGNALKFARPGVAPVVRLAAQSNGDAETVELTVADNGIGFDEKYLDRIFNVFQRLHGRGEYEGTGIGLAVCRKIVERHGGTITASSRPGEGSTFVVRLPVRHAAKE